MQKVNDSFNETSSYFDQILLSLPEQTATKVRNLLDTLMNAVIKFDISQTGNESYGKDDTGLWRESFKSIRNDIPPILKELESDFRNDLGIIEGNGNNKQRLDSGSSPE